jgi:type II pantothenate kinase
MSNAIFCELQPGALGIDAGASLIKLVQVRETELERRIFEPGQPALLEYVAAAGPGPIGVTGGGGAKLAVRLDGARLVAEFDAWVAGAPLMAKAAELALPDAYLLVSLGTGVSAILVREGRGVRVGGTPLGGGSLLGLGRLLLGIDSFEQLVALAQRGDRRHVDLLVGDLYAADDAPLPPEVTASHFGKLDSTAPEDVAHALVGIVAQNLGLLCGQLCLSHGVREVLYCGSTLHDNEPLRDVLRWQTSVFGAAVHFPDGGTFCGALGAAALAGA